MDLEGQDLVGQALREHHDGPVKRSAFMTTIFIFSLVWIIGSLAIFIVFKTAGYNELLAYSSLGLATLSPLVGSGVFILGHIRKYRYKLGDLIEKLGLAIIIVIPVAAILFFAIFK